MSIERDAFALADRLVMRSGQSEEGMRAERIRVVLLVAAPDNVRADSKRLWDLAWRYAEAVPGPWEDAARAALEGLHTG